MKFFIELPLLVAVALPPSPTIRAVTIALLPPEIPPDNFTWNEAWCSTQDEQDSGQWSIADNLHQGWQTTADQDPKPPPHGSPGNKQQSDQVSRDCNRQAYKKKKKSHAEDGCVGSKYADITSRMQTVTQSKWYPFDSKHWREVVREMYTDIGISDLVMVSKCIYAIIFLFVTW